MATSPDELAKPKQLAELLKQFAREEARRERESLATIRALLEPKLPRGRVEQSPRASRTSSQSPRTRP